MMIRQLLFIFLGIFLSLQVQAHVNLLTPKTGETYTVGETMKITWEVSIAHNTKFWHLYYSVDDGETWEAIKENIDVKTLSYDWNIPEIVSDKARVRVVQNNEGADYKGQSGNFSITGVTTPIMDETLARNVKIFPNPAQNHVNVQWLPSMKVPTHFTLFDQEGSVLFRIREEDISKGNSVEIDLSHYPPGVYWLDMEFDEGRVVRQILKP